MTAQIAIMNRSGIALASDTMMSFTSSGGLQNRRNIRKMLSLSDEQPVVAMVNSCATFMRRDPWVDVVLPAFRRQEAGERHETIDSWGLSLSAFLRSCDGVDDMEKGENLVDFISAALVAVEKEAARFQVLPGVRELEDARDTLLAAMTTRLSKMETVLSNADVERIRRWDRDLYDSAMERPWIRRAPRLRDKARAYVKAMLQKNIPFGNSSCIVLAGYGAVQTQPALSAIEVDGYLGPVLKIRRGASKSMASEEGGQIAPFAQREMVDAFMLGMDGPCFDVVTEIFSTELTNCCLRLTGASDKSTDPDRDRKIATLVADSTIRFKKRIEHGGARAYNDPIMRSVDDLDPDGLAEMARSLVSVNVLRQKYNDQTATVGGMIDVATMSPRSATADVKYGRRADPDPLR